MRVEPPVAGVAVGAWAMSEERTQAPSRRRRELARQRGLVARSPELTAAVGLLAAVVLLGAWGGDLSAALVRLVREPLEAGVGNLVLDARAGAWVDRMRASAAAVALPLGAIVGGVVLAMVAAHQVQTGGLWAPGLLAPDPARLWAGSGGAPGERLTRGLWGLLRAAALVAVAVWAIRADLPAMAALQRLEGPSLARAAAAVLKGFAYALGLTLLALGLVDFAWQYRRLEARLRLSPEEHREEQRSADGDPEVRARRLRQARDRLSGPREALAGAALVVTGPGPLAVLLGGDPPPGRVTIRLTARGASAASLRRAAGRTGLPCVESPRLARWFAEARTGGTGPARGPTLPAELAAELAAAWPDRDGRSPENPGKTARSAEGLEPPPPPPLAS